MYVIAYLAGALLGGALLGLLPLLLGRNFGKPGLGKLGFLWTVISGPLALSLFVSIGFSIAVFVKERDYRWPEKNRPAPPPRGGDVAGGPAQGLNLRCLSGPLRGQIYPVGRQGLLLGCDPSCAVRLPERTPGVSHRHCCIQWQQGVPVLIDLNSTYGTYMGDGRRLPPNYPTQLAAGSRFYLGDTNCLFQVILA